MFSKEILGVRVDFGMDMDQVLDVVENKLLKEEGTHYICTTNPEFIIEAQKNEHFKKIINESDLSVPDGVGVIYAKDYLEKVSPYKRDILFPIKSFLAGLMLGAKGGQHKERITGVDLTYKLCDLASKKGYSVFFLGSRPGKGTIKEATSSDKNNMSDVSDYLSKLYPNLNVVGGASQFNRTEEDDDITIKYVKECMNRKGIGGLDILFVAYGHPYQEAWITRNSSKIPAKVSIGVGGTFDYIVGYSNPAPEKYVKRNLGWLYRLFKQPWRIKRILNAFPRFPVKVFLSSLKNL
ncbi:MAG: WecB/TagA/CpsF family glycosyltransferase [Patescibacteria group bacterium]